MSYLVPEISRLEQGTLPENFRVQIPPALVSLRDTKDWKEVVKDAANYNYVCSVADEYVEDRGRWEKIIKRFEAKRNPWLKREGFSDPVRAG